jgi:hypothetical protein
MLQGGIKQEPGFIFAELQFSQETVRLAGSSLLRINLKLRNSKLSATEERNQTVDTSINRRDFIRTGMVAAAVPIIGIADAKADDPSLNRPALRMRQVHLDFHTSELIPGIGTEFDKRQWQDALRAGHVNHVNIFAKCHHSWSYYPTKIGNPHPNLKVDLLGAQIAA